ncbi:hypothetical protein [Brachybacterium sp. YJGR34]|uniref:hypothetical protein n=1 Tax=Brachybacterium sp. YJGR34 TaxID=2059911 RepID=UPI000E0A58F8|nr:hypothetical protein [Brachybacterium sp. YJGR34]
MPSSPDTPVLIDWRTEPAEQKKLGAGSIVVIVLAVLIAIAMAGIAISTEIFFFWLIAAFGVVAALIWVVVLVNSRRAAELAGDDLIEIVVGPETLTAQGGLQVHWEEVAALTLRVEDSRFHGFRRDRRSQKTARATNALITKATNLDGISKVLNVEIRPDAYPAVKARATTKLRKLVLNGPLLGGLGYVSVGLNPHSLEEVADLWWALEEYAALHGLEVEVTS